MAQAPTLADLLRPVNPNEDLNNMPAPEEAGLTGEMPVLPPVVSQPEELSAVEPPTIAPSLADLAKNAEMPSKTETVAPISSLLQKAQPQAAPAIPDRFDINRILASNVDELKAAQDQRDELYRQAQANRSTERVVEGLAQMGGVDYKPDLASLNEQVRLAQIPVERIKEQQASKSGALSLASTSNKLREELQDSEAMNDPNSMISQVYRTVAEKAKIGNIPPNATAKALEKVLGLSKNIMSNELGWFNALTRKQLGEDRIDIARKNAERMDRKFNWQQKERNELSDKQAEQIGSLDQSIKELGNLEKIKELNEIDTGPVANRVDNLRKRFGVNSPEMAAFKADAGNLLATYIQSISGKAVSEPEAKRLREVIPGPEDNDEQFMAKVREFKNRLAMARDNAIGTFEKQGRSVDTFKDSELNNDVYNIIGPYSKYATFEMTKEPTIKTAPQAPKAPGAPATKHVKLKETGQDYDVPLDQWNKLSPEQKKLYEEQ